MIKVSHERFARSLALLMITAKPLAGLSQTYFAQDLKLTCRQSTCAAALIARACS